MVPLGYVSRDKKLVIEEDEAERVRTVFRRYLEVGSIGRLLTDLRRRGIVTKIRHLSDGRTIGGIPFTRGPLAYLLRNRFYIGEVVFKGVACPGEHPPILERDPFEAVQRKLAEQHNGYHAARQNSEALLVGLIFDDRGNRMSPSHSRKEGMRHRYYVSSALIQGQRETAGSVSRVPAAKVEAVVIEAVRKHVGHDAPVDNAKLILAHAQKVEVRRGEIVIKLRRDRQETDDDEHAPVILTVPWSKTAPTRLREVITPEGSTRGEIRPIRGDSRAKLIAAIARGRLWLSEVEAGTATIDKIAARGGCSTRHVNMTISLAFLAPSLVKAAVEGDLSHGVGAARLFDAPVAWGRQHQMLGLNAAERTIRQPSGS
jgi:site-specific DNA recombinase